MNVSETFLCYVQVNRCAFQRKPGPPEKTHRTMVEFISVVKNLEINHALCSRRGKLLEVFDLDLGEALKRKFI